MRKSAAQKAAEEQFFACKGFWVREGSLARAIGLGLALSLALGLGLGCDVCQEGVIGEEL